MNAAKRLEIFRRLHEDNPDPKTELAYTTPFELLVAVTLSAQSTDVGVNKATRKLFEEVKTPAQMVALGEEGLAEYGALPKPGKAKGKPGRIAAYPIKDFYLTNAIARASAVMQECSAELIHGQVLEAAE